MMASLYGRDWSRQELIRYVGQMGQVAGIKLLEGADGVERTSRILEVWTGSGLCFHVLADRALDISSCHYKGISLAWMSPVGNAHPAYYEPEGMGWLRSFQGGLLATCGLDHFGPPCRDEGEDLGLHGRASNLPARYVSHRAFWTGDAFEMEISGEVRQTRVFGENLVLRRRISTRLGTSKIRVEDVVTNEGFAPHPHMILYHVNLGFPLLSETSRLNLDVEETIPRDADAKAGIADWRSFQPPTAGYREQVFIHTPQASDENIVTAEVTNPALGLGLRLAYDRTTLPYLVQWKMMGEGLYVLGVEPTNSHTILGRAAARESGKLTYLDAGESRRYVLELAVVERSQREEIESG
jgi:hypothetical protein